MLLVLNVCDLPTTHSPSKLHDMPRPAHGRPSSDSQMTTARVFCRDGEFRGHVHPLTQSASFPDYALLSHVFPPRICLLPFFLFLILGKGFLIPCPLCRCSALHDLKLHTSVMLQVSFCLFSWQRGFWGLHTQGHCWFKIKDVTQ